MSEPRVYKGTIYLLKPEGEVQIRGFLCKGLNKEEAKKDAVTQAAKIWPLTRVAVGGLRWLKKRSATSTGFSSPTVVGKRTTR